MADDDQAPHQLIGERRELRWQNLARCPPDHNLGLDATDARAECGVGFDDPLSVENEAPNRHRLPANPGCTMTFLVQRYADKPFGHRHRHRGRQIEDDVELPIARQPLGISPASISERSRVLAQGLELHRPIAQPSKMEDRELDHGLDGHRVPEGPEIRLELLVGLALKLAKLGQALLDLVAGQVFARDQRGAATTSNSESSR